MKNLLLFFYIVEKFEVKLINININKKCIVHIIKHNK